MEFYRGIVTAYDSAAHTASVLLVGSMSRVLLSMPVSQQIGPELMAEGTACGVLFFGKGPEGVVICTFDGAPDPWVTTGLIVDGTVAPADLSFSPATPEGSLDSTTTDQTLTTTAATYQTLSQTVSVVSGKTYRVLVVASVEFECTSYTADNICVLGVYAGSSLVGAEQGLRHCSADERDSVTVAVLETITADTMYTAKVRKALSANTEVARRGNMVVLYWEDV